MTFVWGLSGFLFLIFCLLWMVVYREVYLLPRGSRQLQKGCTGNQLSGWRKTFLTVVYIQKFLASLWAPDFYLMPAVCVCIPGVRRVSNAAAQSVCVRGLKANFIKCIFHFECLA